MVEVIITQADRDAAQELCASGWTYAGLAFANHRRAATATLTTENAALAARVEALEGALRTITKCESRFPGDVVDVARAALAGDPS